MQLIGYPENKVARDAFYILTVENVGGFKFKVPARGYNLKSWIDFQASLSTTKKVSIKETNLKEYQKYSPWTTY